MSRITGTDAYGLMEAYNNVYAPQELTEEQVWEEVESWVNSLLEEGYDLSEYTWEEMYEAYLSEAPLPAGNFQQTRSTGRATSQTRNLYRSSSDGKVYKNYNDALAAKNSRLATLSKVQTDLKKQMPGVPLPGDPRLKGNNQNQNQNQNQNRNRNQNQNSATTAPAPRPAAAAPAAPKVAPKPAAAPAAAQTGDKTKDMATFAKANPGLAAAAAERARTRGTSSTTNPLMKDMKSRLPAAAPKVTPSNTLSNTVAAASKPAAFSPAPEVKATNTIAAKTTPTPVTPKAPTLGSKKPGSMVSHFDPFDVIKGHLLDEGYADTEEAALKIMANMSEEWRQSIVEGEENKEDSQKPFTGEGPKKPKGWRPTGPKLKSGQRPGYAR